MGIKQIKDGCWTFGGGDKVCYPWAVAENGGGESGKGWRKAIYLKTTEDLTYINITEDDNGKPLSFDEAVVIFTTARETEATTNGGCVITVAPEWKGSFNKFGVYNLPLNADAYMYGVHFKKVGDLIVETVKLYLRVAHSISDLAFDTITNRIAYGVSAPNDKFVATIQSRYAYTDTNTLVFDYFNEDGKMKAVTIGTDLASSVQIGAGSILEVWIK